MEVEVDAVAIDAWDAATSSGLLRLRHIQSVADAGTWLTMRAGEPSPTFCADEYQTLLRFCCGVFFGLNPICQSCHQILELSGDMRLHITQPVRPQQPLA